MSVIKAKVAVRKALQAFAADPTNKTPNPSSVWIDPAASIAVEAIRSLPVAERMAAMGMTEERQQVRPGVSHIVYYERVTDFD